MEDDNRKFQYVKAFEVLSFQVDSSGRLRWGALGDLFQETAWKHADAHHFGKRLYEQGLYWVMSRFHIKVTKLPRWGDEVKVKTAGRGVDGLFALREFSMVDNQENTLVEGMSSWLLLDSKSKRPKRPDQILPPELFPSSVQEVWIPTKLTKPDSPVEIDKFLVRPSDLDVNSHVNNVTYIRWIDDVCASRGIVYREMAINYLAEALLGQTIQISVQEMDDKLLISGKTDQTQVFLATVAQ